MSLKNLSTVAANNNAAPPFGAPEGATLLKDLNDIARQTLAEIRTLAASDTIASATTCDLGTKDATFLTVSGTTTITGLGTVSAGIYKAVTFAGALTLTHNATSLILPGAANIVTVAGDTAIFLSLGTGNWKCMFYERVGLAPGVATSAATATTATSATTAATLTGLTASVAELNFVDGVTSAIQTQLNALTSPGNNQTPTLLNGWTKDGSNWNIPHYWKGADGVVHIHGRVTGGTAADVFLLPVGYRPTTTLSFPCTSSTGANLDMIVFSSGEVQIRGTTSGLVSFFATFRTT